MDCNHANIIYNRVVKLHHLQKLNIMQALRKAFGKEDQKKHKTGKINITHTIKHNHQTQPWKDLDTIFEKVK